MEVTGGDTDVKPGVEDEDSTFGSEPLLSTAWGSPSDMLEQTLRPPDSAPRSLRFSSSSGSGAPDQKDSLTAALRGATEQIGRAHV